MPPCSVLSKATCASWTMAGEQCGVLRGATYITSDRASISSQQPVSIVEWACVVQTCLYKHIFSLCCCFLVKCINTRCGILYLVVVDSHSYVRTYLLKKKNYFITFMLTSGRWPAKEGVSSVLPAFPGLIRMAGRETGGFHSCSKREDNRK